MNSSSLLIAVGAIAVALGLLLLFGQAESVTAPEVSEAVVAESGVAPETAAMPVQYWEPVTQAAPGPAAVVVYGMPASAPCAYCGGPHKAGVTAPCGAALNAPVVHERLIGKAPLPASSAVVYGVKAGSHCAYCGTVHDTRMTLSGDALVHAPAREYIFGGCGSPVSPCGRATCEQPACQRMAPTRSAPVSRVGACGTPVAPCAERSCEWRTHTCGASCAAPCGERPGINRNVPACVDECGFVQLHSTVRQPLCPGVRFEWGATRGSFLDPTCSDPMYFTPIVHQPGGEDVAITLTITDPLGARYTDHVRLRVRNVP